MTKNLVHRRSRTAADVVDAALSLIERQEIGYDDIRNMHEVSLLLAGPVYNGLFGSEPEITAIHAGLEAGIIGAKLGSRELLACGPTLENAHSPGERLEVASVGKVFRFLQAFVSTPILEGHTVCGRDR